MNALGVASFATAIAAAALVAVQATTVPLSSDQLAAALALSLLILAAGLAAVLMALRAGYRHGRGEGDNWADVLATWAWVIGAVVVFLWSVNFVYFVFAPLQPVLASVLGLLAGVGSAFAPVVWARRRWGAKPASDVAHSHA